MVKTKRLCASCLNFKFNKTLKSSKSHKPRWLHKIDYVDNFIKRVQNFDIKSPKKYDKSLHIYIGKQFYNRRVLYWAAMPSNSIQINDAKTAYSNFKNSGITSVDKHGYAYINFMTPQNYYTVVKGGKTNTTFFRHIHYVVSNSTNTIWNDSIMTTLVVRDYMYRELITSLNVGNAIIINTLPCTMYAKDHIPNTYNLPYNIIGLKNKIPKDALYKWFNGLIEMHYPKIRSLLVKKKLSLYEIPIICYCAHSKCNASTIAMRKLMKMGFVNVSHFSGGMQLFNSKK
tara:strand:+ start:486 stop:1343 length:858 start_codon:yes stop_codon:yes gene_type:complete